MQVPLGDDGDGCDCDDDDDDDDDDENMRMVQTMCDAYRVTCDVLMCGL
jgi:hypothetical protein